ncbi:MAG: response regulator transcription factor [Acidimicrobiia bacterium]|nr:response regulator transcription factor [Acidimicrobiia bacterium]
MRVLVVEDEALIARALREGLEADGYSVDVADRGDDGLWHATEQSYDAIILDLMLPGMNGYLVCRELRARGISTPVMMLTAKDGEFDQIEGLDTGADDYVTKPFSLQVVLARLRALIRRGPTERLATLAAGDLSLDPSNRECRRGDQTIELTPREFSLLRYLMHRVGEPVSKRDLIEHVWNDDQLEDSVIQVYVGYLRRKIDEPFGRQSIETVRGIGYRLNAQGG